MDIIKFDATEEQKVEDVVDDMDDPMLPDLINSLNNECLIKIFMNLSILERLKIEKVCKRWEYLSQLIWYDVKELDTKTLADIDKDYFICQTDVALLLQHCGNHLMKLVLSPICDSKIMSYITEYCLNLIHLELDLAHINESDFVEAFSSLKRLNVIKILEHKFETRNTFGNQPKILNSLPEEIIEIHILSSGIAIPLSVQFLSSLEKFNRLSYLTLRHFELDEITMQEINQKNTLVNLDLTGCTLRNSFDISNLRRLESLTLEWVAGVDTVLTASIAIGCGNLKYLNMTNCSTVTETALQEIAKLENLEKLIISNVSMAQDDMFEQFFQLKYLDCFGCCDITDVGLKKVLEKCSMLEYLDATETGATIETIKTAATMTKYRQNDIILEITLSSSVVEEYNSLETIVTSNYLKIVTSKEGNIEPGEYGEPDNVGVQKIDWYHDEDDFDDCCEIDDDGFELY